MNKNKFTSVIVIFLVGCLFIAGLYLAESGMRRIAPEASGEIFSFSKTGAIINVSLCGREYRADTEPGLNVIRDIWSKGAACLSRLASR